jgi:hypothetical protein
MAKDRQSKIDELKTYFNSQKKPDDKKYDISIAEGMTRAGGQGASFATGDEIEALYKSKKNNTSYDEELQTSRDKLEQFRKTNPYLAYGSEIVGSIPSSILGGAGLANLGVRGAVKGGAILGGAYGAGQGEDLKDRLINTAIGGSLGGVLSGVSAKLFPKTTADADALMKKGVKLTHGQAFGGDKNIGGDFIKGLEESSTSVIGVGSPLSYAKVNSLVDFNRAVIKEAIEPITGNISIKQFNKLVPKNVKGTQMYQEADDFVNKLYDQVLDDVNLGGDAIIDLKTSLSKAILSDKQISGKAKKDIISSISKLVDSLIEDNIITGRNFKNLQLGIKELSSSYKRGKGPEVLYAKGIDNAKKIADDILLKYNPDSALKQLDTARAGLGIISKAVSMANSNQGIFNTRQFLNALKQNDLSLNKRFTARGTGILKETGDLANRVLGSTVADSGTASRLVSANVASDPSTALRFLPASLASNILYSGITRPLARGIAQIPRFMGDKSVASTAGLLTDPTRNTMQQIQTGLLNRGNQ